MRQDRIFKRFSPQEKELFLNKIDKMQEHLNKEARRADGLPV